MRMRSKDARAHSHLSPLPATALAVPFAAPRPREDKCQSLKRCEAEDIVSVAVPLLWLRGNYRRFSVFDVISAKTNFAVSFSYWISLLSCFLLAAVARAILSCNLVKCAYPDSRQQDAHYSYEFGRGQRATVWRVAPFKSHLFSSAPRLFGSSATLLLCYSATLLALRTHLCIASHNTQRGIMEL